MKALFVHDHYYYRDGDTILSKGQYHHTLWQRYLNHFQSLTVIGRDAGQADRHEKGINIACRDQVDFHLLNNTNTLRGKLWGQRGIKKQIETMVADHDVIILRGISELGILAFHAAKAQGKYVAFEIVSCAFDELWFHGSIKAKIYSLYRFLKQRSMAKQANAVIYVSQDFLQRRYPTHAPLIARASNVQLPKAAFEQKHQSTPSKTTYKIGLIGTLKNRLKGVTVAIEAIHLLKQRGFDQVTLHILGPGDPTPYHNMIKDKGLENIVILDGIRESGDAVWQWLRTLDLYIQPSFQEGVPRATIEAMAQNLPVIGSNAGGLPELIDRDWIVKRGDAPALANAIEAILSNHAAMTAQGEKNFKTAHHYSHQTLSAIRNDFWSNVVATAADN